MSKELIKQDEHAISVPVVEEKTENNTNVTEEKVETTKDNTEKGSSESPESEYVDFGDADFSALDNFFGQS